jgi:predicted phage terminase large subunit-like protein
MDLQKTLNAAEQMVIEIAHRDFWTFCKYIDPKQYNDSKPHLKLIAEKLQKVTDGVLKKLAISLPPRAGKSYIVSLWCAWMLGRDPMGSIMRCSYGADLAEKFSKDIRDGMLVNNRFKKVFPQLRLSKKNTAVYAWSIEGNTQPSYFCAGVGGPLTGYGVRTCSILDDPIKNIEEALSETVIEGTWNWYTSTFLSRLETGCPEIHIATRWSRKDPIGRLTDPESEYFDPSFEVIVIPALDESGKSFCEAVKTTEEYYAIKRVTDTFIWEAEFMQNPIEEKGLLFPVTELKRFSIEKGKSDNKSYICSKEMGRLDADKPDGVIGYCDVADMGKDFLCAEIGSRYGQYTFITDVVFTQDPIEITEPQMVGLITRTRCMSMRFEANSGGRQFARDVKKLLRDKNNTCTILSTQNTANKETRILTMSGYIKEYFYFRNDYAPGSDYDKYMRQLTGYVKFGRNTHDDACDCTTGMAEDIPFKSFAKPIEEKKSSLYERLHPAEENYLTGEVTNEYLDFIGG